MNKQKRTGLIIITIGLLAIVITLFNIPFRGLSKTQILILVFSIITFGSGISIFQNGRELQKRRVYVKYALPVALLVIVIGFVFKMIPLPGANIMSMGGTFYLSFSIIPVIAKNRFIRWKNYTSSTVHIIGLMIADSAGLVFLLLSVIFYLLKWPGFIYLSGSGIILLVVSLLLWNKKFEDLFSFQVSAGKKLKEQHKEIVDSITYAQRIQKAILPPEKNVKELLPDSFIIYKPKDIVAGDFYWMEFFTKASGSEGNNTKQILFAACDCTGHGVPGAMVSVVCNNALNRSVREYGLTDPGKILDKTSELVIQEFEKSEEEVKDGMDISLVSLAFRSENESEERNSSLSHPALALKWAGANNPLWLIRQAKPEPSILNFELIEYKPNKQPIGKYAEPKPFTTHEIELKKGDTIYIFTDGFQDQFGGERGKKFKAKAFKELLISIQEKNMYEQRKMIEETFENWKGDLEQNDDLCVIGVKI